MTDMLAEKIVAATGAGMGIGREVAILCADESKDISGEILSARKMKGFCFRSRVQFAACDEPKAGRLDRLLLICIRRSHQAAQN